MDIEVLKKRVTPELERNILDWKKKPESHFTGFNEQPLEWGSRVIGNAVMFGLTDSHGMIFMPNISCDYRLFDVSSGFQYFSGGARYHVDHSDE
ncbi:hypothetical protein, partial [uncultured Vibrio sp.]|uniref:hypothetical protein n=1 Tax=uncultured Vibrio sp. TaxID=114054 RepID=UPI002614B8C7